MFQLFSFKMKIEKELAQKSINKYYIYKELFVMLFTKNKNQISNLITCITKKSMVNQYMKIIEMIQK